MKQFLLASLGLVISLTASAADAPPPAIASTGPTTQGNAGFVSGVDLGTFKLQGLSATAGSFRADFKFNDGWGMTIPLGYDFGNGFSAGVSVGYYSTSYATKGPNNGPGVNSPGNVISSGLIGYYGGQSQSVQSGGDLHFVPVMFNVAYKTRLFSQLYWYAGGGAGLVREDAQFTHFDYPATQSILFGALGAGVHQFGGMNTTQWEFAYQLFTGLSYEFTDNISLNVGYRYLHMGGGITVDGNSTGNYSGQSIEAGLNLKF